MSRNTALLLCFSFIVIAFLLALVRVHEKYIIDQGQRIRHLETMKIYQGKDVNGNEVWGPAVVTEIVLPVKEK